MKRTINEIYDLIIQKIENANNDVIYESNRRCPNNRKVAKLCGEIDAYEDIKTLIESSEVLTNE